MNTTFRRVAALALALPLTVGLGATAQAKTNVNAKTSGNYATVEWGSTQTADGQTTTTFGYFDVRGTKVLDVNGGVEIITCPEGVDPWMDEGGECTYSGGYVTAEPGAVQLTMDKKLTKASLTGTIQVYNYADDTVSNEALNLTLTGFGTTVTRKETFNYTDDLGVNYSIRATDTGRQATVSGTIAGHDLGDAVAAFGTYKNMEKLRIP